MLPAWRGCRGSRSPTTAPWEVPCSPLPPPPSCCSLTQAGAEGGRGICSSIAAFWHQSLCQNQRAFSKKTLNSFNRQLELLPHRSKGHELSVFIALGRFMSLFFKEGRERGKAVAYCLAWGAGREEQGGRMEEDGCRGSARPRCCRKPSTAVPGARGSVGRLQGLGAVSEDQMAEAEAQSTQKTSGSSRVSMRSCQLEGSVGTRGPATSHPRWMPPMGAVVEHPPKPAREALGSCCPSQPALLRFAGWKCWEGAAGVHKWLSSPEHSHGPVQLCSNRGAVLPSPLRSSSIHLLPACQGAQSSLPAAEQVQQRPGCCLSCRDLWTCCWLWDGADPSCHLPQPSSESALPTSGHLLASCAPDTLQHHFH